METIAVWTIVGAVGIFSARSLYHTFTGKKDSCDCAGDYCFRNSACAPVRTELYQIEETKE